MTALPDFDLGVVAAVLGEAAERVVRAVRGEVSAFPRAPRATPTPTVSGPLYRIAVLSVGPVDAERLVGARVMAVGDIAMARTVLRSVRPDVVVTATDDDAAELQRWTDRPVVVDGERLRSRIRLAIAGWAAQRVGRGGR